jgi:hypothetical protein
MISIGVLFNNNENHLFQQLSEKKFFEHFIRKKEPKQKSKSFFSDNYSKIYFSSSIFYADLKNDNILYEVCDFERAKCIFSEKRIDEFITSL